MTFFYEPLPMAMPVLADQQELIYISSVRTLDVVLKTGQDQWMIRTGGERKRERGRERERERESE